MNWKTAKLYRYTAIMCTIAGPVPKIATGGAALCYFLPLSFWHRRSICVSGSSKSGFYEGIYNVQ